MFKGSTTDSLANTDPTLTSRKKYLGDKAIQLRIVEEFLSQIELSLLKTSVEHSDLTAVRAAIDELRELGGDGNPDRRKRVEFQLAHELHLWQEGLAARDEKIEAYHIRRYCDGLKKPLDPEVYLAMARFYRDLPRSKNSQSKFDLSLTRAFSTSVGDLYRSMSRSRPDIAARLSSLYCVWDRVTTVDPGSPRDVSGFDKFIAENDGFHDFRSLTASRLFDRIREFKSELGDRFWDPSVAAAAIECNIVVGNHLNGLMARANENLGERLGAEFDFAGAFQDSSENTGTYIAAALKEVADSSPESFSDLESESESDDLRFLRSLLELSDSIGTSNKEVRPLTDGGTAELSVNKQEFRKMLALLAQHNPDSRPFKEFIDTSDLGTSFELDEFLFGEDQLPDAVGREALAAILSLESFRNNELQERKLLPLLVRNNVLHMLSRAEALCSDIESAIEADPQTASRRLKIANRLLEARLRTERAIVKFTSRGLNEANKKAAGDETESGEPNVAGLNYRSFAANRWLVGLTILIAIVSGVLYYAGADTGTQTGDDVELLEAVKLPGGKSLASAYRAGNTLYLVATDSWSEQSDEDKTESLKELMSSPTKKPLLNILVVDKDGSPVAQLTESGVQLHKNEPLPAV